jgi:hypothetical protein
MTAVTLTIPPEYVERFEREAEDTLRFAAGALCETIKWQHEQRDRNEPLETPEGRRSINEQLAELTDAEEVYAKALRADDSGLQVTAPSKTYKGLPAGAFYNTVQGCLQEAVNSLDLAVGSVRNPDPAVAVPAAQAEVDYWWTQQRVFHEALGDDNGDQGDDLQEVAA